MHYNRPLLQMSIRMLFPAESSASHFPLINCENSGWTLPLTLCVPSIYLQRRQAISNKSPASRGCEDKARETRPQPPMNHRMEKQRVIVLGNMLSVLREQSLTGATR